MLLLILDGKTALAGGRTGILLCLQTVIPALFPFLVLSNVLMGMSFGFLQPLGRLCHMPKGAEALLIPAFLGGYPVGAQSVASAWRAGALEKEEAERLLAFCNNAGPSFLFGITAPLFPKPWMAWGLWGVHVGSAVLTARLLPSDGGQSIALGRTQGVTFFDALRNSVRVMGLICGWVVLFRVVIAFLQRWVFFILPLDAQVWLTGLLELTNGCCELSMIDSLPLRFTLCAVMLASGGLCVTMQTASVTTGLSLRYYCKGKVLQTAFSALLCACLFGRVYPAVITALLLLGLNLRKKQKRAGIQARAGV